MSVKRIVCPKCHSIRVSLNYQDKSWWWMLIDLLSGNAEKRYKCGKCGEEFD